MSPLAKNLKFKLRDTKETVRLLNKWDLQLSSKNIRNIWILTFDIRKFFPNVRTEDCHQAATPLLQPAVGKEKTEFIIEGSEICVKNSVVKYEEDYYKQKRGVPAGLSHICSLTDIGSNPLIEQIVDTAPFEWLCDEEDEACAGLLGMMGLDSSLELPKSSFL